MRTSNPFCVLTFSKSNTLTCLEVKNVEERSQTQQANSSNRVSSKQFWKLLESQTGMMVFQLNPPRFPTCFLAEVSQSQFRKSKKSLFKNLGTKFFNIRQRSQNTLYYYSLGFDKYLKAKGQFTNQSGGKQISLSHHFAFLLQPSIGKLGN